jgi:tetratricopeptide (TPR) repeat protein
MSFLRLENKIPSLALGIFAFSLILLTHVQKGEVQRVSPTFIAPPKQLERFVFGYQEVVADLLWIRAIQDFDYCDEVLGKHLCRGNSWLFKMLDTVTNLSPHFRTPYASGALALTVIISDYEGAKIIFDKGVERFPNDWQILYRAAYHYMYEVKDNKRAAQLLIRAADNGAPKWAYALAGRLYSDSGALDLAEAVLAEMKASGQEEQFIKRLEDKINSMKNPPR